MTDISPTQGTTDGIQRAKKIEDGRFYAKVERLDNGQTEWQEVGETFYNMALGPVPTEN